MGYSHNSLVNYCYKYIKLPSRIAEHNNFNYVQIFIIQESLNNRPITMLFSMSIFVTKKCHIKI